MSDRAARALAYVALPSVLLIATALAPGASAANRQRLHVTIRPLAGQAQRASRPLALHFRLSRWTDEGAISSPALEDRFSLPPGFALHPRAIPDCDVNVLARKGPSACRASQVGTGTLQLAAKGATQTLAAAGSVIVYNGAPSHGHPTLLTYALVSQPSRNEFWFQSVVSANRRGTVIDVRETRLNVYGLPLTVLGLDFGLGRAVGHGTRPRSFVTGPLRCGLPSSRIFGLRTTFYDRFVGSNLDRPAGPPVFTAEPASC